MRVSLSKNALFFSIAIGVTLFHVLFMTMAYYGFGSPIVQFVTPKPMAVQTISLSPRSNATAAKIVKPIPAPKEIAVSKPKKDITLSPKAKEKKPVQEAPKEIAIAPKPKEKPVVENPKKSPPKTENKPKNPPKKNTTDVTKKSPAPQSEVSPSSKENSTQDLAAKKKENLLLAARESIAKIQLKNDKVKAISEGTLSLGKIESLSIDRLDDAQNAENRSSEVQYHEKLAYFLKKNLHLVEPGDVKIKLTLNRLGKVTQLTIAYAESHLNRELIEKSIPNLSFPSWQAHFPTQQTYTCSMTLSHDALPL